MRLGAKYINNLSIQKSQAYGIVFICFCLLLSLSSCRKHSDRSRPSPPDLTNCTSVEIKYYPSPMGCIFINPHEQELLNSDEREYLESLKTIIIDEPRIIESLARDLSSGRYNGTGYVLAQLYIADVTCYHDGEHLISFKDYGSDVRTENEQWFKYPKRSVQISTLTPQLDPFNLRVKCSRHLSSLRTTMCLYLEDKYHVSEWCDDIVRILGDNNLSKKEVMEDFKCSSAGEGKCHYAMNPDCEPNSPPDTVLLFETKSGWNQHGGPELFTFDNHDPKGGCVLIK